MHNGCMEQLITEKLQELEKKILNSDISGPAQKTEEWGGADVIITSEPDEGMKDWLGSQPLVVSFQRFAPRRRLVVTEFSRELSWLFFELKTIFYEKLDYVSKYDFYGSLAQTALDQLEENKGKAEMKAMLLAVVETAKKFEV